MRTALFVACVFVLAIAGCTHVWDSIDVTSNPDVVKNCQRIGSVQPSGGDKFNAAMNDGPGGNHEWLDVLKKHAFEKRADTLLYMGGSSGDAYQCRNPQYHAPAAATPAASTP